VSSYSGDGGRMYPEPSQTVEEVHVDMQSSGLHLQCDRCRTEEIVLLGAGDFDDHVKRFLRTHPTACTATAPQPRSTQ
jgi:hypothetical protein